MSDKDFHFQPQNHWILRLYTFIYDAQSTKMALDSSRLIWAFVVRLHKQLVLKTNKVYPDQTARMCMQIWNFAVRI